MNDSSLNYTGNEIIVPANNLQNLEKNRPKKEAYQQFTVVELRQHIEYMVFLPQVI